MAIRIGGQKGEVSFSFALHLPFKKLENKQLYHLIANDLLKLQSSCMRMSLTHKTYNIIIVYLMKRISPFNSLDPLGAILAHAKHWYSGCILLQRVACLPPY